jgi:hypothetical protein
MICAQCGHEERDDTKFCSECGSAVIRELPRVVLKSSSFDSRAAAFVAVGCLVALGLVAWAINVSEAPVASPTHASVALRSQHVTAAMACATTMDDVVSVAEAYSHGDSDAIIGLIGRRKAILLATGTSVSVLLADSPYRGIDALYVESGSYIGERCYGDAALLTP